MDPWVFKDGTKVQTRGVVSGDSGLAQELRFVFGQVRGGEERSSGFGAYPGQETLDLDKPHLLDSWIRLHHAGDLVSAPVVEYPTLNEREDLGDDWLD